MDWGQITSSFSAGGIAFDFVESKAEIFLGVYTLLVLFPSLAVTARRLQDTNESGWKWLFVCVPLINIFIILISY